MELGDESEYYDIFVSYRVRVDEKVTELAEDIFTALDNKTFLKKGSKDQIIRVFYDKK